jgi:hypothetical protein
VNRLQRVDAQYAAVRDLTSTGVELIAVADDAGARLDEAIRQLSNLTSEDDPAVSSELLAVSRHLRWRAATEPFPARYSHDRETVLGTMQELAARLKLRSSGGIHGVVDDLVAAAGRTGEGSGTADVLIESLTEAGDKLGSRARWSSPMAR